MQREEIIQICDREILETASACFGASKGALRLFAGHEGSENLAYAYEVGQKPFVLRISYTPDRTFEQIQAELHFINYLGENSVHVSRPIPSLNGNLVETLRTEGITFHIVAFTRGKGIRLPDNGYRYRADAPIEEYFRNWGRMLGRMHALAKSFRPESEKRKRPEWFDLHKRRLERVNQLPVRLLGVQKQIQRLLGELESLPRDIDSFALIHGDFNDGNFTVDFSNGEMTVFDFDESCYFWFIYEIASAWQSGTGRVMFRGLRERKVFMQHYMETLMEGYHRENTVSDEWLRRLPLFIRLIQVEEFLHYAQYLDAPDDEMDGEMKYRIQCIEQEIPYFGFFDGIYSPDRPFAL